MELDALKFTVETTALDDAITKVGTLQLAVKKLGSETGSQTARQAAKEQAQITLDQVKAETALIEARGKQARAIENLNSPQEKLTKSVRDSNAVLERQEKIYENMINYGLSKGQASTLAMAQAQDIAAESAQKLVDVMKDTRKYIGGDTFDKSTAGMTAMQNRYETLLIAAKNYADGSVLNIRQAQDLALDTERLAAKNQLLGISGAEAVASINSMTAAFKALAIQENEQSRANDAHAALIKKNSEAMALAERERVAAHLNSGQVLFENNQLRLKQDQQTNKAIMSEMADYYKNLEAQDLAHSKSLLKGGKTQVDITGNAAVALFVKDQETKAKAVAKSANDQIKALAKADEMLARLQNRVQEMSKEGPVSATAANQLYAYEKALRAAGVGADDATARLAVFRAEQQKVSQLSRAEETLRMQHLSRALAPQVTDVTVGLMTGQNPFTVFLQQGGQIRDQIGLSQVAVENLGKVFKDTFVMMGAMVAGMGRALYAFFLTPVGAAILALSAFAIGMYEAFQVMVDGEEKTLALNKALIMFGNSAGLTVNSLKALSKEAATIDGISVGKSTEAMAALAKAGGLTSDEFVKAAQSAVLLERYAGVSLDKTADAFKALSKEPLKSIEKLNEETGFFSDTIIAQVAELERLGKKEEAGALAKDAYAAATIKASNDIKDSLTGFGKFLDTAGNEWNRFWERVTGKNVKVDFGSKIKEIDDRIAEINASRTVLQAGGMNITIPSPMADREVQGLLATRGDLVYKRASENAKAEAQQRQTDLGQNQMDIEKLTNKHMITVDTKTTEINKAIELYNKSINSALSNPETFKNVASFIEKRDKLIHDIQTGKKGDTKAKEEKSEAFSINLSNELQQYEKQYGIEIKLQDDFIRQEKARLDNALAAKEITQGEFNARDLAASERGYTDRQSLSDKYYSGIIQANEKNISEMVQQYQAWVNQEGGTPKFFEQNEKAVETLRSKIINTNNETSVFLEKIQASAASAKENAFTRYSKQLSILQGEIRGVTLAYDEYLQSEANLTKQKQSQVALEDKVRFATPEQASAIRAAADETERLTKQVQDYDKQIRASEMSLGAAAGVALDQFLITGEVTAQTQVLLDKEKERYDLLLKTKGLIESTVSTKVTDAASTATTKYQKDQFKALSDSVAGALEEGLYKGGAEGAKSLRNIIEAELRKPVTIFIKAVVGDLTQQLTGGISGSKQESSLWLKDFGLATTNSIYELGGALTSSGFESLGNSVTGLAGSVSKYSSEITAAGDALSYFNAASLLAEGKYGSAAGSAIGTYFGGPIGGKVGQQIGSLLDGGKFTSASSTGYSNKSFSNTGTASDISTTTKGAGNIVDALYAGYAKKAESLGISKAAARFSFSSNTGREGQNPNFTLEASAGGKDYITQTDNPGLFGSNEIAMSDANMQLQANRAILTALQGSEMPKYLKGAFDSLVVGSMDAAAVNATFEAADALKLFHDQLQLLPFEPLKDLSYTATEALKAFSGGLDKFGANLGTYYDKFYTAQEKTDLLTKNTKKAFEDLGLVLPDINDQLRTNYRAIVEELSAKDLSIAKNAAAYAGVLQLAGAVDQLAPALIDTKNAVVDLAKTAASAAMTVLSNAIKAQKEKLALEYNTQLDKYNEQLTSVTDNLSKLTSLANQLKSTLDGMRISGSEAEYRTAAQAQIQQALNTARSGGGLPLNGELTSALATVSKPSEQLFGSFEDYARDFYRTANNISDLSDITGKALTADEITQKLLKDQIVVLKENFDKETKRLDDILTNAQMQLDAINGINTSILSVADALAAFNSSLLSIISVKTTPVTNNKGTSDFSMVSGGSSAVFTPTPITAERNPNDPGRLTLADIAAMGYQGASGSLPQWAVDQNNALAEKDKALAAMRAGMQSFDIGTNYVPNDMLANIHKGERIIPAADNAILMQMVSQGSNTNELKEEIKDMKIQLKAALDKISDNTKQTSDILDNVTAGGSAMLTEVA